MTFNTDRKYYVYAWYIKDTNEVFYIGKGTGNRYRIRKRENSYFMKMLNSHDCGVRIIKDNMTEEEAFKHEKEMIAYYRKISCRMTNVLDGGEQPPSTKGMKKSDETKQKMSLSMKRFYDEHPEKRVETSEKMKKYLQTEDGKMFTEKSIKARKTDSFRKKQSAICKVANRTPEYRLRQSIITKEWYKKNGTEKYSGKNNHAAQCIQQYTMDGTFVKEYDTITQASKESGANASKISDVARGKRKSAGGYVWKYKNQKKHTINRDYSKTSNKLACAKSILQYDKDNNFIKEYVSIASVIEENSTWERTNIIANLKQKTKHAYGYIWKYKT